ncbi:hypothetical protein NDU88_001957 [Pleurodeles waltl]|uniref:Uncharacterized protein n=1 Tax=Pleurodeles waltl TaxID=8319 RepID=A0AAV7KU77_PLEWA|nr:hypothetical protein NDU88_001957 [Pleurodeles waltl]
MGAPHGNTYFCGKPGRSKQLHASPVPRWARGQTPLQRCWGCPTPAFGLLRETLDDGAPGRGGPPPGHRKSLGPDGVGDAPHRHLASCGRHSIAVPRGGAALNLSPCHRNADTPVPSVTRLLRYLHCCEE